MFSPLPALLRSDMSNSYKSEFTLWHEEKKEGMHCSRDYDVVYWILSDLCVSAKCM